MIQWEYKYDSITCTSECDLVDILNDYGNEGWEVVSIITYNSVYFNIWFKRQKKYTVRL
jgi:hypothetical protein